MADVLLYGTWSNYHSKRVELALKLKGVKYNYIEEEMNKPSRWLLIHNPILKTVPVLLHEGDPIVESLVILEYIDETWKHGHPILPQDPKERAKARFLAKFIDEGCIPALMAACWSRPMMQPMAMEMQQMAMKNATQCLKTLEDELDGQKFFGGDTIGLVDLVASFLALWLGVMEELNGLNLLKHDTFPNLCRWANDFSGNNVIKPNLPPRDQLLSLAAKMNIFSQNRGQPDHQGGPGGAPQMMMGRGQPRFPFLRG